MLSRLDDIIAGDCPAKPAVLQRHWSGLPRSDWNMIFVFSGKCRVCVDETILCDMEAGNFYLFSPGERRHYNADGEFHCFWCHFVPDISVDWKNLSGNCFIYTPSEQESARLRNNMDEVLLLFGHHVQGWHVLTRHLIEEIILRGNMQNSISHIPQQILHACSILSDPTKNHYSFSEVAKKIGWFLMLVLTFTMRTALGISLMFAVAVNVLLSDKSVISTTRKWLISIVLAVVAVTFLWKAIAPEIEEMWARRSGQKANMEWRARRSNGNEFAKYAGAAVFAPLIFSLPFPTMVEISTQETQQMVNGNNFVKNIISFFTIYALFMILFKYKTWRKYTLILSFMIAYLGILAMSEFAQSERFHLPVLPVELIFAALGVSLATAKTKKYFNIWCIFMVIVTMAWSWFKLAGRGMA